MNVYEARVVVRERTVPEIADLAIRFSLRLGAGLYARLAACVLLPAYAVLLAAQALGLPDIWLIVAAVVLFPLLQLPFTVAASRLMFSTELGTRDVLSLSAKVLVRYALSQLLGALLLAAAALLVVLTPWGAVRSLYLGEIVVLEGASVGAAYGRAGRLTNRRFGQSFLVWLTLLAVSSALVLIAEIAVQSLSPSGIRLSDFGNLLWSESAPETRLTGYLAGLLLSAPLVATLRFLSYIDNRTRREGWDIQVRFLELARGLEAGS